MSGLPDIDNFVIRTRADENGVTPVENVGGVWRVKPSVVEGLKNTPTDLLILNDAALVNSGADVFYSSQNIADIKSGSSKTVFGYMSVGSIFESSDRSGQFASLAINPSLLLNGSATDEVFLRFWEKDANGHYKILAPLIAWGNDLKLQGFQGAFLDVLNSYSSNSGIDVTGDGASDPVWRLLNANSGLAYRQATTALIEIVSQFNAAMNPQGSSEFFLGLGHTTDLLLHNAFPGAGLSFQHVDAVADLKAAADFVLVESWTLADLNTPFSEASRIANVLGVPGYTEYALNNAHAFGNAQVLAVNYYNGNGLGTVSDSFVDGSAETWRALREQIIAAKAGITPYATPNFNPLPVPWGTNIEPFRNTHPVFGIASNKPNAFLASAAGSVFDGLGGSDLLVGLSGADNLSGGDGDDLIDGGLGSDIMSGGTGNDTFFVNVTTDTVVEFVGQGTDTVRTAISFVLSDNVENLVLDGTAIIKGSGNALVNSITGNSGANIIDGKGNADVMRGQGGNDTYHVDNAGDQTIEAVNDGTDRVFSTVSRTLADNVEHLFLTGGVAINGTGNALNNVIVGNDSNNTLNGLQGVDDLRGNLGADRFTFTVLQAGIRDIVRDFTHLVDFIVVDASVFQGGLSAGGSVRLVANATPVAANGLSSFLYDTDNGNLVWDQNGNAAGGQFLFATLISKPVLTTADFVVIP